jgi:hypothetical protein
MDAPTFDQVRGSDSQSTWKKCICSASALASALRPSVLLLHVGANVYVNHDTSDKGYIRQNQERHQTD